VLCVLVSVGVVDDLSYEMRSLVLDGDDANDMLVIGGSVGSDVTVVSIVLISVSIELTEGYGKCLLLRRRLLLSMWLILVGKHSAVKGSLSWLRYDS
jgi:hypothetical protein